MIVIVNYGLGNLGSILNMLRKIGAEAMISSAPREIGDAQKIILPGVGAFDNGMKNLEERGLVPLLTEMVLFRRTPVLGICLGMQLLGESSEEGTLPGLGWIEARALHFRFPEADRTLKIPHMGWNTVEAKKESPLFSGVDAESRFYFVHSYYVDCRCPEDVLTTTWHGLEFTSSLQRGNIFGVQFHPEKSHKFGLKLLKNFVEVA